MTTPTIFSDAAANAQQAKFKPQDVMAQKAIASIPPIFPCRKGLTELTVTTSALGKIFFMGSI